MTLLGGAGAAGTIPGKGGSIFLQPGSGGGGIGNVVMGGRVGIGITPANTLEVVAGGTTLADAWTTRSSRIYKTNIQSLGGALDKIERLRGVSYRRKTDNSPEIGLVAEEVERIVPEVVSRDPQTNEVQGVDYSRLAALLIEAVKTQQQEIQQLRAEVQQLAKGSR
jgi:Chaperone of endosialidase